jgi:peptidylprolyl isomerase
MKKLFVLIMTGFIATTTLAQKKQPVKAQPVKSKRMVNTEYTTSSGLKYVLKQLGTGAQATPGSIVSVNYVGRFADGKQFDASREKPLQFKLGAGRIIQGWEEGVSLLKVGDKAFFTIPPQLGYGEQGYPGVIPGNATLFFDIELVGVKEPAKPWVLQKHDTITTESGLKYIVVEKSKDPNGPKAEAGKMVSVHYTGFLLSDGKIFDSSVDNGQPYTFPLGKSQVIKGWDEGIALMQVGDKLRLIVPSHLAYGNQDYGPIPGGSTLCFDVELMGVN